MGAFRFRIIPSLLVLSLALLTFAAVAQVPTGSITGSVRDPDGFAVPGATVTAINEATNAQFTATSGPQGGFLINSIPIGTYKVEVKVEGFRTYTATGVAVETGRTYSLTVPLEVGVITDVVEVDAGGTDTINTTDAQLTNTVDKHQIDSLPLLDRNPLSLLYMQAGVATSPGTTTTVNGMRTSYTSITLDGVNIQDNFIRSNATDFVPVRLTQSTVQEFSVTTQNAGTESGLGASQVSFSTPSGTNDWHGEVNWYHRNNKFAARDWFNAKDNVPIEDLIQNQGAVNAGGPVIEDKLFFWGNYELYRRRQSTSTNSTILTDLARTGVWAYTTSNANDTSVTPLPAGSACPGFNPGDLIPAGSTCTLDMLGFFGVGIDPYVSSALLAPLPLESLSNNTSAGDGLNSLGFRFNQRNNRNRDDFTARVDYNHNEQNQFGLTWKRRNEDADRPDIDGSFKEVPANFTDTPLDFLSVNWRYSPTTNFTNEVRYGFAFSTVVFETNEAFDSKGILDDGFFFFTSAIEEFQRQGRNTDTTTLQDNGTYVWGNHNMTFGFQTQMIDVHSFTSFDVIPSWNNGLSTATGCAGTLCGGLAAADFPGGVSSTALGRANNLLTDLVALVTDGDIEFNVDPTKTGYIPLLPNIRNLTADSLSFYFNDSWRYNPRLTVNLGLRWEYVGRFDEKDGLFLAPIYPTNDRAGALAAIMNPDVMIDFIGAGTGRSVYAKDFDNFGPNVGIAYDLFGDGKTSLRAGVAMHFVNDEIIRSADNAIGGNSGLNTTITTADLLNVTFSGHSGTNPLPTVTAPPFQVPRQPIDNFIENGGAPQTVFTVDPQLESPYVMSWNLGIQRDIGFDTILEVRYNGTRGVKLTRGVDYNQVDIFQAGYLASFNIARNNGFLQQAAWGNFDPRCRGNPAAPGADFSGDAGCQDYPWLSDPNNLVIGPLFSIGFIRDRVERGEAGDLLSIYHFNGLCGFTTGVNTGCAPNGLAGVADLLINYSTSDYHAGTVEVRKRFSDGLRFQANYVWSKVMTDSGGEGQTNFDPFLDFGQQELERNRAGFDLTHQFKANFTYNLPAGEGYTLSSENDAVNKLLGGWSINSFIMYQTGSPFSIVANSFGTLNRRGRSDGRQGPQSSFTIDEISSNFGFFESGTDIYYIDPTMLEADGSAILDITGVTCTPSTLGFCPAAPGTVGNLRENSFDNPNFINWDFSIIKDTQVTERVGAQFRAEFFNFTNTPTFWLGTTENVSSSNFGKFTSTLSTERIIQFALKLTF